MLKKIKGYSRVLVLLLFLLSITTRKLYSKHWVVMNRHLRNGNFSNWICLLVDLTEYPVTKKHNLIVNTNHFCYISETNTENNQLRADVEEKNSVCLSPPSWSSSEPSATWKKILLMLLMLLIYIFIFITLSNIILINPSWPCAALSAK